MFARLDPPPDASFASISVGRWHACGVRTDNVIECWGDNYVYEEYCSSGSHGMPICGLVRRGDYAGQATHPHGVFRAVSAGGAYTCAIRAAGTAECWGSDRSGQAHSAVGTLYRGQRRASAFLWFASGRRRRMLGLQR